MSMVDNKGLASEVVETIAAWMLGLLWMLPLLFAIWTAIHPSAYVAKFDLLAPITSQNFVTAWESAPFARYFLNTMLLVNHRVNLGLIIVGHPAIGMWHHQYSFNTKQVCRKHECAQNVVSYSRPSITQNLGVTSLHAHHCERGNARIHTRHNG